MQAQAEPARLEVALECDQGEGESFLTDICRMLETQCVRRGVKLAVAGTVAGDRPARLYQWEGDALGALAREIGVHRAQVVPRGSATGRVVTSRVVVTASGAAAPASQAVKTYNYVLGRVTRHESGDSLRLEDVLAGLE